MLRRRCAMYPVLPCLAKVVDFRGSCKLRISPREFLVLLKRYYSLFLTSCRILKRSSGFVQSAVMVVTVSPTFSHPGAS